MAKAATLTVKIVSDAKGAAQGFDDAASRVDKFRSGLDKASVVAGGALAGLGALGKAAFDSASDLQQAGGAVQAVFGDMADAVAATSTDAAQQFGLSAASFDTSAALIGAQLQNMGLSAGDAWDKTYDLIGLGSDLAAQYGGTTQQAIEAVSSALKGERDPIEKYAVSLTQASIDAKVAALGLDTHTDAAKRNSEMQATLALITDQTTSAVGAFGRESDTAAGAQQRASAEFENAKAALGDVLLPVVADAMTKFSDLTTWMKENKDTVTLLAAVIGTLAAAVLAVNVATTLYTTGAALATAAQWLWNVAMSANPIMLIVLAIGAIIAAVVLAYNKFDWFKNIVDTVGRGLKAAFEGAKDAIKWVIDKLSFIGDAAGWVSDLFAAPQTMAITPVAAGDAAGLFGAADGTGAWAPIRGASLSPSSGGTSPSAGRGAAAGTVVNITVNGALDAQSVADQIAGLLRRRGIAQGLTPVVVL